MNVQKRIRYLVSAAVLAGAAAVWWACEFERTIDRVGPSAPLDVPLVQILNDLKNSRTPSEAEKAITHLLEKTGIGLPVKGSNYNEYYLPDDFVSELALNHLHYRLGEDSTNWAEAFELQKLVSNEEWAAALEFDGVMAKLQRQAQAALAAPENPNNALVLVMLAPGTALPQSIAAPNATALITPVQEFLFGAWMDFELGDLPALSKKTTGYTHFEFTFVECNANGKATIVKEKVKIPWVESNAKKCMEKARKEYENLVKDCFKQDKKCRKVNPPLFCCAQLKQCLLDAYQHVLSDIEECRQGHDQGKGK